MIQEKYYMDYYYDTSNPSVARVSEDGVITAVGEGKAYISIYAEDEDEEYITDRMTVVVNSSQDDLYITLNPEDEIYSREFISKISFSYFSISVISFSNSGDEFVSNLPST